MPNSVTHIIIALVIAAVIRDFVVKKKFSTFFVLVAGIAGAAPDADILLYWVLNLFQEVPLSLVHRWFTHSLFVPLIFLIAAFFFWKRRKAFLLFAMIALGIFIHIILDILFSGYVRPFYPLSEWQVGLNLVPATTFGSLMVLGLDGLLLILWLLWEYRRRNIKDFI
ncbi:MAG: metal-dependent hydrolase [Nanoarchaeota archaeon]|nr:metal-dependent hydrolase [Nanoarchaeota archaeon]